MNTLKRLATLHTSMTQQGLEAILITQAENRYYLSGFTGSAGYLIITTNAAILATDFRYVEQVGRQAPDYDLRQITGDVATWLPLILAELNIKELAFEAEDLTVSRHNKLQDSTRHLGIKLVATGNIVEKLRTIKEPGEIELITRAVALADAAMDYAASIIQPGLTELALGWEIESFMRTNGSEALPFEVIVAAGPNSSLPHAQPSDRPIGPGEPIVIDIGARIGGYASDLTRTLSAGQPEAELKNIYDIVLQAQVSAEEKITAGKTGHEADSFAREIITRAGYGDNFGHGLGHGLGLVTHEEPRLGPNSTDQLQDNMVFTIEPGIYIPGWGGVRIEDTVVMKDGKISILSRARKGLS